MEIIFSSVALGASIVTIIIALVMKKGPQGERGPMGYPGPTGFQGKDCDCSCCREKE